MQNLIDMWHQQYRIVPQQLAKVFEVANVTTAFNTNIDAVIKINGLKISELAQQYHLTYDQVMAPQTQLLEAKDVVRGIIKCFVLGIGEEWLTEDKSVYEWMKQHIGYDRLQMGGQGGIVANVAAVLGVQNVLVHTASHPLLQSQQFLDMPNLVALDANGQIQQASKINRTNDNPLIHWIIEFDKDDTLTLDDKNYRCPKANRFIATYDIANLNLIINPDFIKTVNLNGYDYLILSGYHSLTSKQNGLERIKETLPMLKEWKKRFPNGIIHLELASTQDKTIRKAIIEQIAPLTDSLGLNEREAIDALEIINPEKFAQLQNKKLSADILFDIVQTIKDLTQVARIQLHMFGLYLTLQNKHFTITPLQNKNGMMLAATVAASKAGLGEINTKQNLLWAQNQKISEQGLSELHQLARHIDSGLLETTGIASVATNDLIAVPTIIVAQPKTLVGMGDTISSVSLIGAR